jgi:hypothetical protein
MLQTGFAVPGVSELRGQFIVLPIPRFSALALAEKSICLNQRTYDLQGIAGSLPD